MKENIPCWYEEKNSKDIKWRDILRFIGTVNSDKTFSHLTTLFLQTQSFLILSNIFFSRGKNYLRMQIKVYLSRIQGYFNCMLYS